MNYKIEKTTADVYKIRIKGSFSWAAITIRRWFQGGSIDVQSDFGSFSYSWPNIGPMEFRAFLTELDYGYFMGKAAARSDGGLEPGYRFSPERSIQGLKELVIDRRRGGELDGARARECWKEIEDLDADAGTAGMEWFVAQMLDRPCLDKLIGGEFESIPIRSERCPQCNGFWTEIWPIACEVWRDELAQKEAA